MLYNVSIPIKINNTSNDVLVAYNMSINLYNNEHNMFVNLHKDQCNNDKIIFNGNLFNEFKKYNYVTTATLTNWANYEIIKIQKRVREIAIMLFPNINVNEFTYSELLKLFSTNDSQKFKNNKEVEDLYHSEINKNKNYFQSYLTEYEEPQLYIFNDKNKAGGYFYINTFYLNTFDFENMRKYEIQSLTLHETIPGHHSQLTTCVYSDSVDYLTLLFSRYFNGFIEGWGLFAETLCNYDNLWNEFGMLEMRMMRILRVVIDINLNAKGAHIDDMIKYMSEYLTYGIETIKSEIYRYIADPAQALCYYIGYYILTGYFEKIPSNDKVNGNKLKLYNEFLHNGHRPLYRFIN